MKGDKMKWVYTFVLLALTIGWAVYTVETVKSVVASPTAAGVLEASGTSVLLGALIAWNANVNQFWFRKKGPVPPEGGS